MILTGSVNVVRNSLACSMRSFYSSEIGEANEFFIKGFGVIYTEVNLLLNYLVVYAAGVVVVFGLEFSDSTDVFDDVGYQESGFGP